MTTFILYDGRAVTDTDDALIMDTASTEEEATERGRTMWAGTGAIWWEEEYRAGCFTEERPRHDLPPFYDPELEVKP